MTFDIRPIWLVAALCSWGFGFLVLLLRRNFSDYLGRALTYWGVAYLCFGGLFFLCLGGDRAGPLVVYVAGRTLGAVGFVFEYWAITALKRQRHSRAWLVAPPAILFAALIWNALIERNVGLALAASNFVYSAIILRNAVSLMMREDDRRPFVDVLAGLSFVVLAASTLVAAAGFARASHFSVEYDLNSALLIYNTIVAIVVESVLFGLFLLAVSERLNDNFKFQATHDHLTELYNRRAFEEIGREEVSGAARTGLPISLLMVDIDHFKQFNDTYGPAIGDFILRAVAEALQRCLGEDYLCRWGGDEFCVLLPGISRAGAEQAVERLFAAMAELDITVEGEPVRVEVSIGVVTREENVLEFPLLMKLADVALYQAKEKGRNQSAFA